MADEKFSEFGDETEFDSTSKLVGLHTSNNAQWDASLLPITQKFSLTSSQILNLNSTPITLIAAPGAGKIIRPLGQIMRLNYGTTTYAGNAMNTSLGGNTVFSQSSYASSADAYDFRAAAAFGTSTDLENTALIVTVASANPTTGDSTIDLYITYTIVNL